MADSPPTVVPWFCPPQGGISGCPGAEIWVATPPHSAEVRVWWGIFGWPRAYLPWRISHTPPQWSEGSCGVFFDRSVQTYVSTEPQLQPLMGEQLNTAANTEEAARLDVKARGFWCNDGKDAFFDIRVFHLMHPAIRTPNSLVFIVSMNVRRSLSMPDALLRSSMDASLPWCLRHPEACHLRQRRSSAALLA